MYIMPSNIRTQQLRGTYVSSDFPLPTDSLARAAAAPAAAAAIAKAASARGRAAGMSGGYVESAWTAPPYRNTGMGFSFADAQSWAMAPNAFISNLPNIAVYGGGAAILFLLMGGKRGRR